MPLKPTKTGDPKVDKALDEIRDEIKQDQRSHLLGYGAADIGTGVSTRYLFPGYDNSTANTNAKWQIALHDGFLQNLKVGVRDPGDTADTIKVVVRVNEKDTPLSVQFSSLTTGVFSSKNNAQVPVKAGDRVSVVVIKGVVYVTSPGLFMANLELVY